MLVVGFLGDTATLLDRGGTRAYTEGDLVHCRRSSRRCPMSTKKRDTGTRISQLEDGAQRAKPILHQHAKEVQPYGKIAKLPIALDETACESSINNLNQIVGDFITLPKQIKNTQGQVIGETPEIFHGFVDVDGKLRDVNGLLNASGKGWVISRAQSINDLGRITAFANLNGGPQHAVELTPNAVLPNLVP